MSPSTATSLVLALMLAVSAGATDYCTISSCPTNSHTLCKYPNDGVADTCPKILGRGISEYDKNMTIFMNNIVRWEAWKGLYKEYNLPAAQKMQEITWDDELAAAAQRWADQCPKGETDECRDVERFPVQQITFSTLRDWEFWSFYMWKLAHPEFPLIAKTGLTYSSEHGVKYMTQMLWANTTKVGCGHIVFAETVDDPELGPVEKKRQTLVCNYGTKGNIEGELIYQPANES